MTWAIFVTTFSMLLLGWSGSAVGAPSAETTLCSPISPRRTAIIKKHLLERFELELGNDLSIRFEEVDPTTCATKLLISSRKNSKFVRELWLTPDHKFLTVDRVWSVDIDPRVQEKRRADSFRRALNAGMRRHYGKMLQNTPEMVVFSDFQCPACARLHEMIAKETKDDPDLSFDLVFRHYPLTFHEWASQASENAICAGEQDPKFFWFLHDFYFANQSILNPANLSKTSLLNLRGRHGFSERAFSSCVESKRSVTVVDSDFSYGSLIGLPGTPTVYINGAKIGGIANTDHLRSVLKQSRKVKYNSR